MSRVNWSQLSEPVRQFLDRVRSDGGVLIEDEGGQATYSVIPYQRTTPEERSQSRRRLEQIQKEVGDRMSADGRTEEELDRILQEVD